MLPSSAAVLEMWRRIDHLTPVDKKLMLAYHVGSISQWMHPPVRLCNISKEAISRGGKYCKFQYQQLNQTFEDASQ